MKLSKTERSIIFAKRRMDKAVKESHRVTRYRKTSIPSKGEQKIIVFLVREGVEFRREWWFPGLYSPTSKRLLYFDFFIPKYNLCIEFDGSQHYAKNKPDNQKLNDFAKNAFCAKNKINFLRIKYDQFEDIEKLICAKVDKIV